MEKDKLKTRLEELQREFSMGESRLRELTQEEVRLREVLLRISGAIQMLEELSDEQGSTGSIASATQNGDGSTRLSVP
jgi:predicted nuclease with TOPRIM domain